MSQYFSMGEEPLWNPSSGAARLFLRQTAVFEAELGLPSGLGPMENDECQIDSVVLGAFANAVLAHRERTRHAVILALSLHGEGTAVEGEGAGAGPAHAPVSGLGHL
ncbi:DUF6086 family protein [Streptomyces antimycoticus]